MTRRRALLSLFAVVVLGRAISKRRVRYRSPDDLAPIPWIGHC